MKEFIMTQLEHNLQKSIRTLVEVWHDDIHVANVFVVPDTLDRMLNDAYMQTQSINNAWYISSMVDSHVDYARSTRLTDRFVIEGVTYTAQSDSSISDVRWAAANV